MSKEFFEKINGFSNDFWGWGGEDDELLQRVIAVGSKLYRNDVTLGRYQSFRHTRDPGNAKAP